MKTLNTLLLLIIIAGFTGCKKEAIKVIPTIHADGVTNITATSATCTGEVTSDGGSEVTSRGVCWSTSPSPTIANDKTTDETGIGIFTSSLTGLMPNTNYYVIAYATNSVGTAYDVWGWFRTDKVIIFNPDLNYGTVTDIDHNIYKTIKIGTQTWMAENLKTTKYRDGNPILCVPDGAEWSNLLIGGYCNYNNDAKISTYGYNDAKISTTYGRLYNWLAISDSRGIAPSGWHVPTNAEWDILINYLGGKDVTGAKLKETGTANWLSPNIDATNETGFTALPGGYRGSDGVFQKIGEYGCWRSSSSKFFQYDDMYLSWGITHNSPSMLWNFGKIDGYSVRCLKD